MDDLLIVYRAFGWRGMMLVFSIPGSAWLTPVAIDGRLCIKSTLVTMGILAGISAYCGMWINRRK